MGVKTGLIVGLLSGSAYAIASHTCSLVTHADATLSASASPTPVLGANAARVKAYCQNTGGTNSARLGDVNVGGSRGVTALANGVPFVTFDGNGIIYGYSAAGTPVSCTELVCQ